MESSSSNTELNRTTSIPVKHENETTKSNLKPYSSEINLSHTPPSKSSPPLSPLKDPPFHNHNHNNDNDNDNNDKSTSSTASSPSQKSDKTPVLETPLPKPDTSDSSPESSSPVTAAPPNQEMNRSPSAYRIPASVFERSKSSTPMDWSVASNESLFSIHMGNMSFTNDHYFWRSGDLGPPAEASTSDQIFSYSGHQSRGGPGVDIRSHELGIAEATMLEVIKECEGENRRVDKTYLNEVRKARRSAGSNTSNKSFAFSLMGGETGSSKRMPSSVRSNREQVQSPAKKQPSESQPGPKTPTGTRNRAQPGLFSCFSCCVPR